MTTAANGTLTVEVDAAVPQGAVALGWPVRSEFDDVLLPDAMGSLDGAALRARGFTAKAGQAYALTPLDGGTSWVLLGMGDGATLDADRWRRAAAAFVRAAGEGQCAALMLPADLLEGADALDVGVAVAEGAVLAAYRFNEYRTSRAPSAVDRVVVVPTPTWGGDDQELASGVMRGERTANAVAFARELINTPAADLPPRRLAERAAAHLRARPGVRVTIWDQERLVAERMGGVLGVSGGSSEPARFVRADYEPDEPRLVNGRLAHVVLVGKGVTFDSGGLSLKTPDGMSTMKTDMSGAAIVLATVAACADVGVRVRVTALAPMAENLPGVRAMKAGDVLTIRDGTTVEVLTTDAEGRLLLADALALAAEFDPVPDAVVDVATLTGAARIALGTGIAPLFSSEPGLSDRLREAGAAAGERLWPMPLPEDYREHLDSEVADVKNTGRPGQAGAISAALFLSRFAAGLPWAHIDIAGTGRSAETSGYLTRGGNAFGVRTLVNFLLGFGT